MQLAASDLICVHLKKNIHHQYLTHQVEVLQPTVALCELLLLSYDVSVVNICYFKMRLVFKKNSIFLSDSETVQQSNSDEQNYFLNADEKH